MGVGRGLRILGIDPGTYRVGFGCVEVRERAPRPRGATRQALAVANAVSIDAGPRRVRLLDCGVLELGGRKTPIEDRLFALGQKLSVVLRQLEVDEVALEEAFYKKSVSSALRIGEARGVILAGCRAEGLAIRQFSPARIKRAVAGHGAASKDGIATMVCQQLGMTRIPASRDTTDALAAAFCRAQEQHEFLSTSACKTPRADL